VGLFEIRHRNLDQLSGGQKQRAWIAMALAQETSLLMLDEPTAFLDMHYQFEILNLLRVLKERDNKTILMVLHDLNMASLYGDFIVLLKNGEVFKAGSRDEVLTRENLFEVFGIKALPVESEEGLQFVFSSTI
jgi:iron complex transport system ATP-binding protein